MDIKALTNRVKTRVRYFLVSDLWIKKVIPASFRHLFSGKVIDHSILMELLTNEGAGTLVKGE